jgi:hypothetical protein
MSFSSPSKPRHFRGLLGSRAFPLREAGKQSCFGLLHFGCGAGIGSWTAELPGARFAIHPSIAAAGFSRQQSIQCWPRSGRNRPTTVLGYSNAFVTKTLRRLCFECMTSSMAQGDRARVLATLLPRLFRRFFGDLLNRLQERRKRKCCAVDRALYSG